MTASLCGAFLLSGAAALLFESLWFRLSGLALGSSLWASTAVLASFMAGLALGNLLAARGGERVRRPLRLYAALEASVAVLGLGLVLGAAAGEAARVPRRGLAGTGVVAASLNLAPAAIALWLDRRLGRDAVAVAAGPGSPLARP